MANGSEMALPRWQSHKQVYADRIVDVRVHPFLGPVIDLECGVAIELNEGDHRDLRARMVASSRAPVSGDYYVRYDDGYESWSPKEAFERGYTRLHGAEKVPPPTSFRQELEGLVNRFGVEGGSHTPDFILAEYLLGCLDAWNRSVGKREEWFGRSFNERANVPADH